jgi:hypothetical protein
MYSFMPVFEPAFSIGLASARLSQIYPESLRASHHDLKQSIESSLCRCSVSMILVSKAGWKFDIYCSRQNTLCGDSKTDKSALLSLEGHKTVGVTSSP